MVVVSYESKSKVLHFMMVVHVTRAGRLVANPLVCFIGVILQGAHPLHVDTDHHLVQE